MSLEAFVSGIYSVDNNKDLRRQFYAWKTYKERIVEDILQNMSLSAVDGDKFFVKTSKYWNMKHNHKTHSVKLNFATSISATLQLALRFNINVKHFSPRSKRVLGFLTMMKIFSSFKRTKSDSLLLLRHTKFPVQQIFFFKVTFILFEIFCP